MFVGHDQPQTPYNAAHNILHVFCWCQSLGQKYQYNIAAESFLKYNSPWYTWLWPWHGRMLWKMQKQNYWLVSLLVSGLLLFLFLILYIYFFFYCPSVVAPDISVVGYDGDWYVGRENVQMTCKANANPPAHHFRWIRCVFDIFIFIFFLIDY